MPEAYPVVLTLARTGLRIGEALTLHADDLDFQRRELRVRPRIAWMTRPE